MFRKILASFTILLFVLAPMASFSAEDKSQRETIEGTLEIKGGGKSVKIEGSNLKFGEIDLGEISISEDKYKIERKGTLGKIVVNDARGSGEGYSIYLKATKFVGDYNGEEVTLEGLSFKIKSPTAGSLKERYKIDESENLQFDHSKKILEVGEFDFR